MKKAALALEGGSLRSMFTAGILDVLMENGVKFDAVFGVSAGSLSGVSYVSGQIGRTKKVNVDFSNDPNYYGLKSLVKNKSIFNLNYMLGTISNVYLPLDREAFMSSDIDFTAVATDCNTGEPVYFNKHTCSDIYAGIRASSSIPLLAPMVEVDGIECLDGGVTLPIPYQKPLDEGYERVLVVPTREHGFLKPQTSHNMAKMIARKYYDYPNFVKAFTSTPKIYAQQANEIDKLAHEGKIMVVRPASPISISRAEKDATKLIELYNEGRAICEENLDAIKEYIS